MKGGVLDWKNKLPEAFPLVFVQTVLNVCENENWLLNVQDEERVWSVFF